jgi:fermentation-respiration switch protein FrsA (DUF1100 family)
MALLRMLGFVATICAIFMLALMALEDTFIYFPARGGRVTAEGSDVWLRAADGVKLHAFHVEQEGATRTLLYLHGNAGNLAGRSVVLEFYAALGFDVLGLDYRGYGQSEGKPSEAGLNADALAAYDWLAARMATRDVIVLGESLGGGPACELALRQPVGGLVLLSTFTSIADMAARTFPMLPVRYLVRTRFDNLEKLKRIEAPKLIVHSRRDEIIPFAMGEQLARAAKPPVQRLWLERATHNDTYFVDGTRFGAALVAFADGLPSGAER